MSRRRLRLRLHFNRRTRRELGKFALLLLIAAPANSLAYNSKAAAAELAGCLQGNGDIAVSACTAFLASGEGSGSSKSQAHILRGNAYFQNGDYDQALNDYDYAIALVPDNPVALYNRGNIETTLGQYDRAIHDYTQAIDKSYFPYAHAFNNRCFAYNARGREGKGPPDGNPQGNTVGDYEKAAYDCRRAIQLDPIKSNFYLGLGNALNNSKDFNKALRAYGEAIQWDAKNAKAFLGRCSVDISMNNFSGAVKDCGDALELDTKDFLAWNNRCWARAVVGIELQEALSDCNRALKLKPNDPYSLDSRALTYLKLGSFNEAIADYNKVLAFKPGQALSLYGRGIAKLKTGNATDGNHDIELAKTNDSLIAEKFRTYRVD
jgi:tetratricopeptide (TPR) repeat protein